MSSEATSLSRNAHTVCERMYNTVDTLQDIETAVTACTTTGVAQLALVTIALRFPQEARKTFPLLQATSAQSRDYYYEVLRRLVRKTDKVYLLADTFYFLLLGANEVGGRIVQTRLWDALLWGVHNTSECDIVRPRAMTVGHAAYPAPYASLQEFLIAAETPWNSFDQHPEKALHKTSVAPCRVTEPEEELTVLARRLGLPYLSLLPRKKAEQVQRLVTLKLAHELQCYPLGRERGMLTVAFSNPQDSSTLDRLHEATGLRIFPVLTHPLELQTALSQLV